MSVSKYFCDSAEHISQAEGPGAERRPQRRKLRHCGARFGKWEKIAFFKKNLEKKKIRTCSIDLFLIQNSACKLFAR